MGSRATSGWFWHSRITRARTRCLSPPAAARAGNRFAGQPIRQILGAAPRVRLWNPVGSLLATASLPPSFGCWRRGALTPRAVFRHSAPVGRPLDGRPVSNRQGRLPPSAFPQRAAGDNGPDRALRARENPAWRRATVLQMEAGAKRRRSWTAGPVATEFLRATQRAMTCTCHREALRAASRRPGGPAGEPARPDRTPERDQNSSVFVMAMVRGSGMR